VGGCGVLTLDLDIGIKLNLMPILYSKFHHLSKLSMSMINAQNNHSSDHIIYNLSLEEGKIGTLLSIDLFHILRHWLSDLPLFRIWGYWPFAAVDYLIS
jgi:hypothetical protein